MSIDSESFAELTLFLSTDKELQVRAHVTKKGKYVFCVKDFICQTSNRDVGPNESILLWIHAVGKLLHEDHILENIPVQFAGPYEKPCICISAEGLLILYHFLDQEFNLTEIKYRDQVQNVLMDVVSGKNMDSHIYMHDDGEIRELMMEKGDYAYSNPPAGSKFIFIPTVVDVDGNRDEIPVPVYVSKLKDNEKALLEKIRSLEKQNMDLINQSKKHEQTLSTLEELKFLKERKRQRKEGFCVQDLCSYCEIETLPEHIPQLCKNVISAFRAAFPEKETYMRHGKVYFYPEDKDIVISLLHQENLLLQLNSINQDEIEIGIGAERFHPSVI